jgi:ABC-type Fe3+/spermidine/putrescine transport system ATPase subunit
MPPNGIAVYCKAVAKTYTTGSTKVLALRGVDLDVRLGELLMLVGPSGCGKTTTLRMIAGFEQLDAGTIQLDGGDITAVPPNRRNIGMVFQSYACWPHMTVYENVAFPLKIRKVEEATARAKVEKTLRLVGLVGLHDHVAGEVEVLVDRVGDLGVEHQVVPLLLRHLHPVPSPMGGDKDDPSARLILSEEV